ncbi:MAG: AbrB/MazE/SpoVT family DNA-binding domain-containing protein [Deltaproteobacteria bacterium]|nr:AbrB/MazE/SpoVT family DNA-binding domain-containing protein [Deltaproteobacteria bacterium]
MRTVVSERGQIVVPKPLRDRLGLRPGQVLDCREERGRLVAVKVTERDGLDAVYGILRTRRRTAEIMRELRGDPASR